MITAIPYLSKENFIEILQDQTLLRPDDLLIFKTIYFLDKQEASATELAILIGWPDKAALIGKLVGLGRRILKKYLIHQREREDGSKAFWDFFFTGSYKGTFFIYKLKPELKEALEECGMVGEGKPIKIRNTYLFVWNPKKWIWQDIDLNIEELKATGKTIQKWSCRSHKKIRPGDRAFLAKVGDAPRGIFASGTVISEPFMSQHWSGVEKDVPRVLIEFDVLLNPEKESILTTEYLATGNLQAQNWIPQSSGISIKPELVGTLEEEWFYFLNASNGGQNAFLETAENTKAFVEGAAIQVIQTRYERNPYARRVCLNHYGHLCIVCGFDFEKFYGKIGFEFIHVHHLKKISTMGNQGETNPIDELRPVYPNCHAMLHKKNPPLSIDELKEMIRIQ
jgi:5-methylcytosine-specific restriction protein A